MVQELLQRNKEQLNDQTNNQYKSEEHQRWIQNFQRSIEEKSKQNG